MADDRASGMPKPKRLGLADLGGALDDRTDSRTLIIDLNHQVVSQALCSTSFRWRLMRRVVVPKAGMLTWVQSWFLRALGVPIPRQAT